MTHFKIAQRMTLIFTVIMLLIASSGAVYAETADPKLYTLETGIRVQNIGDTTSRYVRIRAPLISTDQRYGTILEESYNLEPDEIIEENGKRIGVFYVRNLRPGSSFTLSIRYTVDRSPSQINEMAEAWENGDEPKIAADNPTIIRQAHSITNGLTNQQDKVQALLHFTNDHIRYDRNSEYRNQGALSALTNKVGVCEDYATLFVSLARASGIESRMVYGYYYSERRQLWERHAWAEFRIEDGSWTPVDPTMGTAIGLESYNGVYIAQWHRDLPIRMGFVGGRIQGGMQTSVSAVD